MRIAVGGIHIECSTYNPVLTRTEDFAVLRGTELAAAPYFGFLGDYPATWVPTIHARAVPGGPISRFTYEALKAEFLDGLRAAPPLDGLYLAMHGAMFVEGMEDAEGDWISAARGVVGPDCIVAASYDLHGNVTQRILDCLDIYSTYRTAPHIDVEATMRRSVSMLTRALASGEIPHIVWAPIPVVLPGERTSTVDEPARGLYARLPSTDAQPGIWDASLMVGYVWADEPRATAAAVMTGTDHAALVREAEALAQAYWDAREDFVFGVEAVSLDDGVRRAIVSATHPVVVAESGDNPTGGGVGDRSALVAHLEQQRGGDGRLGRRRWGRARGLRRGGELQAQTAGCADGGRARHGRHQRRRAPPVQVPGARGGANAVRTAAVELTPAGRRASSAPWRPARIRAPGRHRARSRGGPNRSPARASCCRSRR